MSGDRAYLIGVGRVPADRPGRHRSAPRLRILSFRSGRHRAGRAPLRRPSSGPNTFCRDQRAPLHPVPQRRDLPTGVATLLVVLAGATAVSGWFAASGAAAVGGMIAH